MNDAPALRAATLGWPGILRLGAVQAMLGAVVVLLTSTMNRVMLVELHLPAMLPAALVALQYGVQVIRPAMGHGSDRGGRRVPWINGGVALLAVAALLAAEAMRLVGAGARPAGIGLAVFAYALFGIGVGTAGTALLALLGQRVAPARRPAAAAAVWIMMIAGIAVCAGVAGQALAPFSLRRLLGVTASVSALALLVTLLATAGIERGAIAQARPAAGGATLLAALAHVWRDRAARRFTVFVSLSMLAYSAEEILLEPFAGFVFGLPAGATAQLTGQQHAGALLGMLLVAACSGWRRSPPVRHWVLGGCIASAAALLGLALCSLFGAAAALHPCVLALGLGNGVFAVAAIGSMMQMAGRDGGGVRIGVWGAAQALAFAAGDLGAGLSLQAATRIWPVPSHAFAVLLLAEAALFGLAALQAVRVFGAQPAPVEASDGMRTMEVGRMA